MQCQRATLRQERIHEGARQHEPLTTTDNQNGVLLSTQSRSGDAHQSSASAIADATESPAALTARYQLFDSFFEQLQLEREVYAHKDKIVLRWPRKLKAPADYTARLQRTNGRIYAEAEGKKGDKDDRTLAQAISIPDGEYELILMPSANEYYVRGVRIQRKIPLSVVRSDYRTAPYGAYVERQIELLRQAIALDDGLFSEIAKMTLGWWDHIKVSIIARRRKSTSCSVQSRPHSPKCTLFSSFRGLTIGANHKLRAAGRETAWSCQMGKRADHGSFADFRKWVLAARFECKGLTVSYRPLGGKMVNFGWNEALCIDGEEAPLHQPNHYEGPHCVTDGWPATQMVVVHGGQTIQFDFASG